MLIIGRNTTVYVTVFAVAKLVVINDLWEIDEVDPRLVKPVSAQKVPKNRSFYGLQCQMSPKNWTQFLLLVKCPHFKR